MRILYLAHFGKPHGHEGSVADALEESGCRVVRLEAKKFDRLSTAPQAIELLHRKLQLDAPAHRVDFVLFSKYEPKHCQAILNECKQSSVLTVTWIWDLYWSLRSNRPSQFLADMLFTTDGGHDTEWQRHGANHQVLRQGIDDQYHYIHGPRKTYTHDVAFVGGQGRGYHPTRGQLIRNLKSSFGGRFLHVTNTYGHQLSQVLSGVKIIVGDSYPSPNYWSNRVYELLGRGVFMLYPHTSGLDEEFTDGEHYIGYGRDNYTQLANHINEYLVRPKDRERIRFNAFHRCSEFTYTKRVETLLRRVNQQLGADHERKTSTGQDVLPTRPQTGQTECGGNANLGNAGL